LLTRLSGFNMVRPLGKAEQPEYGMATPSATVTIQSQPVGGEAKTITLVIGQQNPETNNYVIKSSDSEYYVEVASFSVENFINRGRDAYLTPPPTPEATTPITATNFITGFEVVTVTTPVTTTSVAVTVTTPVTATEVVTPAQ